MLPGGREKSACPIFFLFFGIVCAAFASNRCELTKPEGSRKALTEEAFTERVGEMRGTLYRVSCAYLTCDADRADAVQEALVRAWRALPRVRDEQFFSTYLIRILIRECVNIQRYQKRVVPVAEEEDGPAPENAKDLDLYAAFSALPEKLRVPIVLFYMEGMDVRGIGKALKIPKGTVCSRLKRAREQLKAVLKEDVEA